MKRADIAVPQLSLAQKLNLMEDIWADLSRNAKSLKSLPWHETVLKDREGAYATGKVTSSDWEQAKRRIKMKLS